jgi:hypothetical protein
MTERAVHVGSTIGCYRLESQLGEGGTGTVYLASGDGAALTPTLATSAGHPTPVALKITKSYAVDRISEMRQEISLLGHVRHPGLVHMVDHGVHNGLPWYAMDILEPPSLRERLDAGPLSHTEVIDLVVGVAATLSAIHAEGYLHGDLKPDHIFVGGAQGPVLGDLNLLVEGQRGPLKVTPAYAAPEAIRGQPLDARTDLYALGCITFELIAGHPPFPDPQRMLADHLNSPPPPLDNVPGPLGELIDGLLAKTPEQRPAYACDIVEALRPLASGRQTETDSVAPHLYAPKLRGRDDLLSGFRRFAPFNVRGGAVLIGGESGSGKTVLARRLEGLLADQGWHVVSSHATAPGRTSLPHDQPLSALLPLLQAMVDFSWVKGSDSALELFGQTGGTLRLYHKGIATLPGLSDSPSPHLAREGGRMAVLRDLEKALTVFARHQRIALIIDDLHWADELTLHFLGHALRPALFNEGILVIGLFRVEEAARLSELLESDWVEEEWVNPLDRDDIMLMAADVLAAYPPPPRLVDVLIEESHGNPLFVVEYLRMAVDRGYLARGSDKSWQLATSNGHLPIPDSIGDLVHERLATLSEDARHLATLAALIGRECGTGLLTAGLEEERSNEALAELLSTRVLMMSNLALIHLAHEGFRQQLLADVPPEAARQLHAQLAATLETRVANDPARHAQIAHHFTAAGDLAKALEHHEKAGDYAFDRAAFREAARHYHAVIGAAHALPDLAVHEQLARWLRRLASAEYGSGHITAAERAMEEALGRFGLGVPNSPIAWSRALVAEILRNILGRPAGKNLDRVNAEEAIAATSFLAERYFFANDLLAMYTMAMRALNLGALVQPEQRNSLPYAYLGYAAGTLRLRRRAELLLGRGLQVARRRANAAELAYVHLATAMYHAGFNRWNDARQIALDGLERTDPEVDPAGFENLQSVLSSIAYYQGRLTESLERATDFQRLAEQRGNAQRAAWGAVFRARVALARGEFQRAGAFISQARTGQSEDGFLKVMIPSLSALVDCRLQHHVEAAEKAHTALEALPEQFPTNFTTREAYMATVSVFNELATAGGPKTYRDERQRAMRQLRLFGRVFPMASAINAFYRELAHGRQPSGRRLKRLMRRVEQSGMPLDTLTVMNHVARFEVPPYPSFAADHARLRDELGCADNIVF